jgi:hypothetical protein
MNDLKCFTEVLPLSVKGFTSCSAGSSLWQVLCCLAGDVLPPLVQLLCVLSEFIRKHVVGTCKPIGSQQLHSVASAAEPVNFTTLCIVTQ